MRNPIHVLDAKTIHKIAAGEVIDRPASVVKELVENALDAQACSIQIKLEGGGCRLISVSDDGCGIHKNELALALTPHATSKLTALSDLDHLDSFGFRGEALASMTYVGHVSIQSCVAGELAYRISAEEGHISEPVLDTHPLGTTVQITELFASIPVRRRYLKSAAAEASAVCEIVRQMALIHPHVDIVVIIEGEERLNTTGIVSQETLICTILDRQVNTHLCRIHHHEKGMSIDGFISDPRVSFANRNRQVTAVNGRIIKSPLIQKAIQVGMADVIVPRRFPLAVLHVAVDFDCIDVNIHPQKWDVKFLHSNHLFSTLYHVIKTAMTATHDHLKPTEAPYLGTQVAQQPMKHNPPPLIHVPINDASVDPPPVSVTQPVLAPLFEKNLLESDLSYMQVLNTYLFIKTENGVSILDQHAVHERILYEKIKKEVSEETGCQPLLIAETVYLGDEGVRIALLYKEAFAGIGLGIKKANEEGSIHVCEVPAVFSTGLQIGIWLNRLIDQLMDGSIQTIVLTDTLKEQLQMKACKAAIKAGQRLTTAHIRQLISDFRRSPSNFTCPHGRPLCIDLDQHALERLFLRR